MRWDPDMDWLQYDSQYYNGKIGVVRMYNRALSAGEVANNFTYNRKLYGI
jgi:hypothetical protein